MGHPLIDEFVQQQVIFNASLRSGNSSKATEDYNRLSGIYSRITSSDVEAVHKGIAFDQVSSAYQSLQSLQGTSTTNLNTSSSTKNNNSSIDPVTDSSFSSVRSFSARDIAVVCSFVVLVLGVLLVDPKIVGFSILGDDNTVTFTKNIGLSFDKTSELIVPLSRSPKSIHLSGSISGGNAKVYLLNEGVRTIIVDSSKNGSNFSRVCGSACNLKNVPKDFTLLIEVSEGSITIESLEFDAVVAGG